MEAHIRYLAIVAKEPEALAHWYATLFQTQPLGRTEAGDVSITDGYYHNSFFRQRLELGTGWEQAGLHHIGVAVDDVAALERRLRAFDSEARLEAVAAGGVHGDLCVRDPIGYPISVSAGDFGVGNVRRGVPGIRHVAFAIPATDRVIDFYTQVFGMRELPTSHLRRQQHLGNRFAGDGCTNLALHPYPPETGRELGREPRVGLNHFGFLVPACGPILDELGVAAHGDYARPANRPYAEYRIHDPEGNAVDISQLKGWEVDVDRWERAG
jgi:catechol 2,3-dioxygenase-like lactoylglutathione lyase family enzyme